MTVLQSLSKIQELKASPDRILGKEERKNGKGKLTDSMILSDMPSLVGAVDEILSAIENGHFTQIPRLAVSKLELDENQNCKIGEHEIKKTVRTKSISEIDETAEEQKQRLMDSLSCVRAMMGRYYSDLKSGQEITRLDKKERKDEAKRIADLATKERTRKENAWKKLTKDELIFESKKNWKYAKAQLKLEQEILKISVERGMDKIFSDECIEKIEKDLQFLKPQESISKGIANMYNNYDQICKNATLPELKRIIEDSEARIEMNVFWDNTESNKIMELQALCFSKICERMNHLLVALQDPIVFPLVLRGSLN